MPTVGYLAGQIIITKFMQSVKQVKSGTFVLNILLNQKIGRGGQGQIYTCFRSDRPQQALAVKVLKEGKYSIKQQIEAFKALDFHPNIVRIEPQLLVSQNNYYILMQKCDKNLNQYLKERKTLGDQQFVRLFYEVGSGLKHLFENGFVHQDIKPQNILLKGRTFKLADFGLTTKQQQQDNKKSRFGTLFYMCRDRFIMERKPNPQDDLFSFGVILFRALSAEHPYIKDATPRNVEQYLKLLQNSEVKDIRYKVMLSLQPFVQGVYSMLQKSHKNRMTLPQFYKLLQLAKNKLQDSQPEHSFKKDFKIPNCFQFAEQSIADVQMLKQQNQQAVQRSPQEVETIQRMQRILGGRRIVVYVLDRLARGMLKLEHLPPYSSRKDSLVQLLIYLRFLALELVTSTLTKRSPFPSKQWVKYRHDPRLVFFISSFQTKDQEELQTSISELLSRKPAYREIEMTIGKIRSKKDYLQNLARVTNDKIMQFVRMFHFNIDKLCERRIELQMLDYLHRCYNMTRQNWSPYLDLCFLTENITKEVELEQLDLKLARLYSWFEEVGVEYSITLEETANLLY